jgi:hypothetical protein
LFATYRFFEQPEELKKIISKDKFRNFNGYSAVGTTHGNKTESVGKETINPRKWSWLKRKPSWIDRKEHFACMYQQDNDPLYDSLPHPIPHHLIPE